MLNKIGHVNLENLQEKNYNLKCSAICPAPLMELTSVTNLCSLLDQYGPAQEQQ